MTKPNEDLLHPLPLDYPDAPPPISDIKLSPAEAYSAFQQELAEAWEAATDEPGWYHVEGRPHPLWFDGDNLFDDPSDDKPYGAEWLKAKRSGPLIPAPEAKALRAELQQARDEIKRLEGRAPNISGDEARELQDILHTLTDSGTALKTSARELVGKWEQQKIELATSQDTIKRLEGERDEAKRRLDSLLACHEQRNRHLNQVRSSPTFPASEPVSKQ